MNAKKCYVSPNTCIDGTDSHDWRDDTMKEEGVDYPIKICRKCGYWF